MSVTKMLVVYFECVIGVPLNCTHTHTHSQGKKHLTSQSDLLVPNHNHENDPKKIQTNRYDEQ